MAVYHYCNLTIVSMVGATVTSGRKRGSKMRSAVKIGALVITAFSVRLLLASDVSSGASLVQEAPMLRGADQLDGVRAQIAAIRDRAISAQAAAGARSEVSAAADVEAKLKDAQRFASAKSLATCPTQALTIPANVSGALTSSSCLDPVLGNREDIYVHGHSWAEHHDHDVVERVRCVSLHGRCSEHDYFISFYWRSKRGKDRIRDPIDWFVQNRSGVALVTDF
ncbi:MAG TPA: hypothetical protein VLC46_11750 [Thermoanaerobaculia bacterium]|nr:hypothetical protein [Thermoanaerobaculia bacterium]